MIDTINKLTKELPGYLPLEGAENDIEQRYALAKMYSEKGFRDYMERMIRVQVSKLQDVEDLNGLFFQKGRILALKELYKLAKDHFNDVQKLSKKS